MERIICELSGLPGTGKTTVTNLLIEDLKKNYNIVSDNLFFKIFNIDILNKIFVIWFWFNEENKTIKKLMKEIYKECVNKKDKKKFYRKELHLIRCIYQYKYNKTNNIIISEGFIQAILELLDFTNEEKRLKAIYLCAEIFKSFKIKNPKINYYILITDYVTAHDRIKKRIKVKDYIYNSVDIMSEQDRDLFLKKRYNNIFDFLKVLEKKSLLENVTIIDSNNNIENIILIIKRDISK